MLHLVTGWKTAQRHGDPEVLYCGLSRTEALKVSRSPRPGFLRIEYADVLLSIKTSPSQPQNSSPHRASQPVPSPETGPAASPVEASPLPAEGDDSSSAGDSEANGPSLLPGAAADAARSPKTRLKSRP